MLIGIDALAIGFSGGRTFLRNLLSHIGRIDNTNRYLVFVSSRNLFLMSALPSNFEVWNVDSVPSRRWSRALWEQFKLPLILRKASVDLVITLGSVDLFAYSMPGLPTIVVIQLNQNWMVPYMLSSRLRNWYLNAGVRLSCSTASKIVVMSNTAKRELIETFGVRPDKVQVLYYGLDSSLFKPQAVNRETHAELSTYGVREPYILSISSVTRYKNHLNLIKAYARLKADHRIPHQLVIVGAIDQSAYYQELIGYVESEDLTADVIITDFIPHEYLPALYSNAALYVFPSLCETFGMTQIEAMACGIPVITSNVSVMPEICGDAAVYFDPYDPDSIVEAISTVLQNEELQKELSISGLERAKLFSWEKNAVRMLQIVEAVAGES